MKNNFIALILSVLLCVSAIFADSGIVRTDFSPNGKLLGAVNENGEIVIWDLTNFKQIKAIDVANQSVSLIKFLPDGKSLAYVSTETNNLIVIDFLSGRELNSINLSTIFRLENINFSADGQMVWLYYQTELGGTQDVYLVDLKGKKVINNEPFKGYNWISNYVKDTVSYFDNKTGKVKILSAVDGKEISSLDIEKRLLTDAEGKTLTSPNFLMNFTSDGAKIIFYQKTIGEKSEKIGNNYLHNFWVYSVANGKLLNNQTLSVRKSEDREFSQAPEISISPDGTKLNLIEVSNFDDSILLTSVDTDSFQRLKETLYLAKSKEWYLTSPDGNWFFTSDETNKLKVFSNDNQKQVANLTGETGIFTKLAVSSDSTKFAAATKNGLIKIWSSDGKVLQTINSQTPTVNWLVFSPNGQNVVSVHYSKISIENNDKTFAVFKIWNLADGKLIRQFNNYFYIDKLPENFIFFNSKGDRIIYDCSIDREKFADLCSVNVDTNEFYGKSFPLLKNAKTYFWLAENQSFNIGKNTNNLPAFADFGSNDAFLLWNLADDSLMKQTVDETDFAVSFPKNQNGKLIELDSRNYEFRFKVFEVSNLQEIELNKFVTESYRYSFNQNFGFRLISAPAPENSDSTTQKTNIPPTFSPDKGIAVSTAKMLEIKDQIEIINFFKEDSTMILKGHNKDILDFSFVKNERGISTSSDGTIRVWDLVNGKEIMQLK